MARGYRKDGTKLGFQKGNKYNLGKHPSEETRKKMRKNHRTKRGYPILKGKDHPLFGKQHSLNSRKQMSKSAIGKHLGINNGKWKGGKYKNPYGYIHILNKNHPFADKRGYVFEHRLIIEKTINRYISNPEETHHINGIRDDNRIENLMVFKNKSAHRRFEKGSPVSPKEIIFDGRNIKHPESL